MASEKQLRRELEQVKRELALLRSRVEKMNNINWSLRSNNIVRELIEIIGQLELEADPIDGIALDDSGTAGSAKFESPMPGQSTARARRALEAFQRRMERAIRDQHNRWDSEVTK